MSFIGKLLGLGATPVAGLIKEIGVVLDETTTSEEERANSKALLAMLEQNPARMQVALNKIEAQHRTVFVAGWRPAIGWICAFSLFFAFFVNPMIQWVTGAPGPDILADKVLEITLAMLGLSGLRTYEKTKGK